MATVPASYIKTAPIAWEAELAAAFGLPVRITGRLEMQHPPLGVWSMLEIIDSRFIKDPGDCDTLDVWRALYLLCNGRNALFAIAE